MLVNNYIDIFCKTYCLSLTKEFEILSKNEKKYAYKWKIAPHFLIKFQIPVA